MAMRVTITGGTGLIGRRLVGALRERGDDVTVLSRSPERAARTLGVDAVAWQPLDNMAPPEALAGCDGVVHLLGENVAQRWTDEARPPVLVSSSAVGLYGARGDEVVTEETPPGDGFLADVCVAWEREAEAARALGARV